MPEVPELVGLALVEPAGALMPGRIILFPDDLSASSLRPPPSNLDAERAVLGAIFVEPRAYERVAGFLRPEHFHDLAHAAVFGRVVAMMAAGETPNPVTLKAWAEGGLADHGGPGYLNELAACAVAAINAGEYGRLIRDLWAKRRCLEAAAQWLDDLYGGELSAPEARARLEEALADLGPPPDRGARPFAEFVDQVLADADAAHKAGHPLGLQTGLIDLDRKLGGFRGGDLLVVAGATSMGKTAWTWGVLGHAARAGVPSLLVSLEMAGVQLALRELAAESGVEARDIRAGRVDFLHLTGVAALARPQPIWIDDEAHSLAAVEASARLAKRRHKIGLVAVDYLQLIEHRAENRTQEVSQISGRLKRLARELDVPVLAVSQISRGIAGRDDKRPQLSDLRDSGSIEQDADVILMIHREAYYLERAEPQPVVKESTETFSKRLARHNARLDEVRARADCIVAKHRNGPTGVVALRFDGARMRFENLAST